jgi:hypothetical protein
MALIFPNFSDGKRTDSFSSESTEHQHSRISIEFRRTASEADQIFPISRIRYSMRDSTTHSLPTS